MLPWCTYWRIPERGGSLYGAGWLHWIAQLDPPDHHLVVPTASALPSPWRGKNTHSEKTAPCPPQNPGHRNSYVCRKVPCPTLGGNLGFKAEVAPSIAKCTVPKHTDVRWVSNSTAQVGTECDRAQQHQKSRPLSFFKGLRQKLTGIFSPGHARNPWACSRGMHKPLEAAQLLDVNPGEPEATSVILSMLSTRTDRHAANGLVPFCAWAETLMTRGSYTANLAL